jgi:hypothetical protein
MDDQSRRDVNKLGAVATVGATLNVSEALAQPVKPAFFTPAQLALLDELSEMIIPADAHSPGARAAKVAAYIDMRVGEAFDADVKTTWQDGLTLVDRLSQQMHGAAFMQASPDQRVAVLTRMAQNEEKPATPEEKFFVELKERVVQAYYTSEIGIKQELEYKGNSYLAEFVGTDVSQEK